MLSKANQSQAIKMKSYLKIFLLPHFLTMLLLLPAAPLWLMGGIAGFYITYPDHIDALNLRYIMNYGLILEVILCFLGISLCSLRHQLGLYCFSVAVWLWFAFGFLCLSKHY